MSPFSWQCQNLCLLSLAFIIDWRVVAGFFLTDFCSPPGDRNSRFFLNSTIFAKLKQISHLNSKIRQNFVVLKQKLQNFSIKHQIFLPKLKKLSLNSANFFRLPTLPHNNYAAGSPNLLLLMQLLQSPQS